MGAIKKTKTLRSRSHPVGAVHFSFALQKKADRQIWYRVHKNGPSTRLIKEAVTGDKRIGGECYRKKIIGLDLQILCYLYRDLIVILFFEKLLD